MKIATKILLCLVLSFIGTNLLAASYYCFDTNQVINEGDPMEKVQAACGMPTEVSIKEETVSTPMEITEWVYMNNHPIDPTKTADYLPYLTVVFNNQGKVTKLKQSQLQAPNEQPNTTCSTGAIKIGDDMPTVQINCGTPTLVNKLQSSEEITKKVVEWTYKKNSFLVPLALRFEDGILKQIKTG